MTASRLFAPGTGALPPVMAGRAGEQAVLSRCLADLVRGAALPHDVALIGPRGNGKTALLVWFQTECRRRAKVDVLSLTPHDMPDVESMIDMVAPRRGIAKLLPRKVGIASVGSAEWPSAGRRNFKDALAARCSRRPLALLLDEAHTLDVRVGGALLNASQQVRAEAPFLLVLAGTPGLVAHLDAMVASFWSRLGEGLLGIGRLDRRASEDALVEPFAQHQVRIKAQTLSDVIAESQGYPYFIQLWGDALWQHHLATGAAELGEPALSAARPKVAAQVADYYQSRYRELRAADLLPAALATAPLLVGQDATASEQDLEDALATAGIDDPFAALEGLNRLGYVWRPPNQLPPALWQAGIPSLTAYILDGR